MTQRETNPIDVEIGKKVRQRRSEIGMSQERLAELLGVTFQQVQKYEKGVNRIAASRLWAIAAAMKQAVSWFYPSQAAAVAERTRVRRVVGKKTRA